jgi:hypothetical protein
MEAHHSDSFETSAVMRHALLPQHALSEESEAVSGQIVKSASRQAKASVHRVSWNDVDATVDAVCAKWKRRGARRVRRAVIQLPDEFLGAPRE